MVADSVFAMHGVLAWLETAPFLWVEKELLPSLESFLQLFKLSRAMVL